MKPYSLRKTPVPPCWVRWFRMETRFWVGAGREKGEGVREDCKAVAADE